MRPLRFLDANCGVGPYWNPPPRLDWSVAGLLRKMDELGIAEACPVALMARDYDPWEANKWSMANVAASERIHPVWAVGTHHAGEFPSPRELVDRMRVHQVRMLRLFLYPQAFLDRIDLPILAELFDVLNQHRTPLIIDCSDPLLARAADLEPILQRWPQLPIILSVPKVVQNERWFYYLWARYGSLHLDLSGYQVLGGIEAIVRRFGPEKLVYGSRYPYFTPLQTMMQLIYSEIGDDAKQAIAGGTVRRLLADVNW